jgi:hypothetical protein
MSIDWALLIAIHITSLATKWHSPGMQSSRDNSHRSETEVSGSSQQPIEPMRGPLTGDRDGSRHRWRSTEGSAEHVDGPVDNWKVW